MRAHYSCSPGGCNLISSISSPKVSRGSPCIPISMFSRVSTHSAGTYNTNKTDARTKTTKRDENKTLGYNGGLTLQVASSALQCKNEARRSGAELGTIDFKNVLCCTKFQILVFWLVSTNWLPSRKKKKQKNEIKIIPATTEGITTPKTQEPALEVEVTTLKTQT